jgi:hypothetical protein
VHYQTPPLTEALGSGAEIISQRESPIDIAEYGVNKWSSTWGKRGTGGTQDHLTGYKKLNRKIFLDKH